MHDPADDFRPTATWPILETRARLLREVRTFFDARGFLEVETPILSHDVVVDRHLDPIAVTLPADPRQPDSGSRMWLQTSPEFGMKRLLADAPRSIYQITRAFRAGESGPWHNPEFTMVEWYRVDDDLNGAMQGVSDLAEYVLARGPAERRTYRALMQQHAGVDPWLDSVATLRHALRRHQIDSLTPDVDHDRGVLLDWLMVACVEPHLGRTRPTLVYHYPAEQAALARVTQDAAGDTVSERFELYVDGLELANGYHELLDPLEFARRNAHGNQLRAEDGKPALPETSRLLAAMQHGLPHCSGVALGFDRLVMVATSAKSLRDVVTFPIDRA